MRFLANLIAVVLIAGGLTYVGVFDRDVPAMCGPAGGATGGTAVAITDSTYEAGQVLHNIATQPVDADHTADVVIGSQAQVALWWSALAAGIRGEAKPDAVNRYEARAVSYEQAALLSCAPCPTGGVQPAYLPVGDGPELARRHAAAVGWTGTDLDIAVAIAGAESGWNPAALSPPNRNGTLDHGLWQINSVHEDLLAEADWSDPAANARMARIVWERAGGNWTPWTTYNTGAYREHLSAPSPDAVLSVETPTVALPSGGSLCAPARPVLAPAGGTDVAALVAFGEDLRARGLRVAENTCLGDPPGGMHSPTGWHYKEGGCGAIDVNSHAGESDAEKRSLSPIAQEALDRGFGVIWLDGGAHDGHLHIDIGTYRNVGDLTPWLVPVSTASG